MELQEKLLEEFNKSYKYLYDNDDNVPQYDEMLYAGDELFKAFPAFIGEFSKVRGSLVASDREVVALVHALRNLKI